ncbi:hypothetical protein A4G18_02025 [Pasteurellaceae bacterium Pebbles2]|nr:hypothetical protein [Pasteurellaceae bacterium Pebbles2]
MFRQFAFYATLFLSIFATTQAQANPFSVSEEEINAYLAKKNDVQDKFGLPGLFSMNYTLQDLTAKIGENNSGRVEINGTFDTNIQIQQKKLAGKLTVAFDTIPYYNPEKGEVYLRDLRILRWSGSPEHYVAQLQSIMPFLSQSISGLLSNVPIYRLDDSKVRDALIKKFAKGIVVEQGRLSLEVGSL